MGMHGHRRAHQLRLPRPDRQPDAENDLPGPLGRQRSFAADRKDGRADTGAPARPGLGGCVNCRIPRFRRGKLCLRLRLHRGWRPHRRLNQREVFASMPVVLDPDAAAVYKAFQEAGRPAYETLTAPEARAYYAQARFATNPEPPDLARIAELSIPAPHGAIPARLYVPKEPRRHDGLSPAL